MQQPSVGRIVHYVDLDINEEPIAALITKVDDLGAVDLTVFPPGGAPLFREDVQHDEDGPDRTWHWPPRV